MGWRKRADILDYISTVTELQSVHFVTHGLSASEQSWTEEGLVGAVVYDREIHRDHFPCQVGSRETVRVRHVSLEEVGYLEGYDLYLFVIREAYTGERGPDAGTSLLR